MTIELGQPLTQSRGTAHSIGCPLHGPHAAVEPVRRDVGLFTDSGRRPDILRPPLKAKRGSGSIYRPARSSWYFQSRFNPRLNDLPLQAGEESCGNQSAPTLREDDLYRQTGRCLTNPKLPVRRSEAEGRPVNV